MIGLQYSIVVVG